ncbi:MAG: cation transporter [Hyphomicrobiales bacterium]|nr:MAG: cation transporter [Hyphomicrobiales bacterium]
MMLVASFDAVEIATGIVVAGFVAALSVGHLALLDDIILTPLLPFHLARYFLLFFRELIRANLDVAARVVAPSVDITPEIVEVHTELHSDLGKLWLANSITLTPGTLTIDIEDQTLKVHWIDVSAGTDTAVATREIAARFEAALKEFLK